MIEEIGEERSEDNMNSSLTFNKTPINMKVIEKRPHFYHVICYDLMMETMAERAENVKKINQAQRALYCLVCNQEKIARDEQAHEEEDERQRQHLLSLSLLVTFSHLFSVSYTHLTLPTICSV